MDMSSPRLHRLVRQAALVAASHHARVVLSDGRVAATFGGADFDTTWRAPLGATNAFLELRTTRALSDDMVAALDDIRDDLRDALVLSGAAPQLELIALMSHEIRTPLSGVIGLTELLASTKLDEEQQAYVDHARHAGQSLLTLVNDVLDLSKLEAGATALVTQPFQPDVLVEDVVALVAERAQRAAIELWLDVDPALPALLLGDPSRLRQVAMNLIGNAVKFTDSGEVAVHIGGRPIIASPHGPAPAWMLELSVRDTGLGIPEGERDRIFEPFVQVTLDAPRREGTGLGLAISRSIARAMGGDVTVRSELGRGSTFTLSLPLSIEPFEHVVELPPLRVLLVDDHRSAPTLERLIGNAGATVVRAPAHALHGHHGRNFDVLLLDHTIASDHLALDALSVRFGRPSRPAAVVALVDLAQRSRLDVRSLAGVLTRPLRRDGVFELLRQLHVPARHVMPSFPKLARPMRVLVAEDDMLNQFLVTEILKKLDCDFALVPDGLAAVHTARVGGYDVVLMDCAMPEMDGYEATRRIRALDLRTPIVALTADASNANRERCLDAGMDDYLSKPFDVLQLARVLDRWRDGRSRAT